MQSVIFVDKVVAVIISLISIALIVLINSAIWSFVWGIISAVIEGA